MIDFIIVGQGLTGSLLAYSLYKAGKQILVLDNAHKHASSKVAAGLINPVTGRRFVKSWRIESLLECSLNIYSEIEVELNIKIINKKNILRALDGIKAENDWYSRYSDVSYQDYIGLEPDVSSYSDQIDESLKYGEIKSSYQIDLPILINSCAKWLISKGFYKTVDFNYNHLELTPHGVNYEGINASAVIFSEGYKAIENPFFNYLPFQPVKGEVIYFESDGLSREKIIRHDQYIVPINQDIFWSGGGYNWNDLNEIASPEFLESWIKQMDRILKLPYNILDHKAGVRPSVKGRKPLLGRHPKYNQLYICNGMGTKGSSLAPYCVEALLNHILKSEALDPELSITRFDTAFE